MGTTTIYLHPNTNTYINPMREHNNPTPALRLHHHQRRANDDGEHRLQGLHPQHRFRASGVFWTRACLFWG